MEVTILSYKSKIQTYFIDSIFKVVKTGQNKDHNHQTCKKRGQEEQSKNDKM